MKREIAVKGRHDGLEKVAEGGGTSDALAGRLQEDCVRGVELQDGIELFRAKVLYPGFADLREGDDSGGLGSGYGGAAQSLSKDYGESQECDGGAPRAAE